MKRTVVVIVVCAMVWSVACSAKVIKLLAEPWPPYVIVDAKGEVSGADVEVTLAVLESMGYQVQILIRPWRRVLSEAQSLQADGVIDLFYKKERESWVAYPNEPLSVSGEVIFSNKRNPVRYDDLQSLKGLKIGIQQDYFYGYDFERAQCFKKVAMTGDDNIPKQLTLLQLDRLDGVVMNEYVGQYWITKLGLQDEIGRFGGYVTKDNRNFLAFTKRPGGSALAEQFGEALKHFKEGGAYVAIMQKYQFLR